MEILHSSIKINIDRAIVRLAGIALASLAIYILAFFLPANLFENYTRARLELKLLFSRGVSAYVRVILAFVGLGLLYIFSYRTVRQFQSRAAWVIVIVGSLVFAFTLLLIAPFDAADIYDTILHGRISGVYGANPYQQVIADYPQDPFYDYTAWKHSPSAYGPLWELLAGLAARWAGDGIIANVLIFKFLAGLSHLVSVAIIWVFLRQTHPESALPGVLLLAWNPVVLYETWGNGHNDMVMAVWILVAIWFMSLRRYSLSVLSLTVGTLIKFIPLLLFPAALAVGWQNQESSGGRYLFLSKVAIAVFAVVTLAYYPFWTRGNLLSIERRAHLFTTSIPAIIYKALGSALGIDPAAYLVTLGALGVLGLFVLYQSLWRLPSITDAHQFLMATFSILTFYVMVACLWFQQWYSLWLITLAPLLPKHARRLALFFGFWVLSKQLIFAPMLIRYFQHQPERAVTLETMLTLGVLGPTWIYALRYLKISRQMRRWHNAV
jgi:hypothetical protein